MQNRAFRGKTRRNKTMIKILFICLGNICRSPLAEFYFKDLVAKHNLSAEFFDVFHQYVLPSNHSPFCKHISSAANYPEVQSPHNLCRNLMRMNLLLSLNFRNIVSGIYDLTNDIFCTLAFSFHCDHTFFAHTFQYLCCL